MTSNFDEVVMRDLAAKGITPEFLKECFDCDPVNGNLLWKCRPLSQFKTKAAQVSVNNRFANKTAGFERPDSSMSVKIGCDWYYLHDIIFTIYHGRLPTSKVYHLNGDKRDNRVINLSEYIPQNCQKVTLKTLRWRKMVFSTGSLRRQISKRMPTLQSRYWRANMEKKTKKPLQGRGGI
jgi:hypothetical protein